MTNRTSATGGGVGGDAGPAWAVLAVTALGFVVSGAFWIAGTITTRITGHQTRPVPFGTGFAVKLATSGVRAWWPDSNPTAITVLAVTLIATVVGLAVWVWIAVGGLRPPVGDPYRALATPKDLHPLTPTGARRQTRRLRPSLAHVDPKRLRLADIGLVLGTLLPKGPTLVSGWEDVGVAVMAPRSGKTSSLSIPMVLSAPGLCVVTENKAGIWEATARLREQRTGRPVWVFDPNRIARIEQTWWWNPLASVTNYPTAARLAGHFTQTLKGPQDSDPFWTGAAQDLLASLLLAAAASGQDLHAVYRWLNDSGNPEPERQLRTTGHMADADVLAGRRSGATETREGIYENARTAVQCLRNPDIMRWVAPHPALNELDIHTLITNAETLYLMAKEDRTSAGPLVAAMVDAIFTTATEHAEQQAGGRLDPPATVVLDEAANIVKIEDLPQLYSHLGSRGISVWTILQSRSQGQKVWGETGFDTLWSAATVKLVGAGIDDASFAEDISRLIGDHDVPVQTTSRGHQRSTSTTVRKERVIPAAEVRALEKGTAILLATGCKAAHMQLRPWFEGIDRHAINHALTDRGVEQ
jgi:type IV secretory pathway TraG/TraD family ATPase VirD4